MDSNTVAFIAMIASVVSAIFTVLSYMNRDKKYGRLNAQPEETTFWRNRDSFNFKDDDEYIRDHPPLFVRLNEIRTGIGAASTFAMVSASLLILQWGDSLTPLPGVAAGGLAVAVAGLVTVVRSRTTAGDISVYNKLLLKPYDMKSKERARDAGYLALASGELTIVLSLAGYLI
ncbi:hypothetical protein [Solwaraspora sp. WMMA2101]|uniref:hypothetical protein n=1 Tax=Solwaraspora sp. WMMA2101 TaxID=3404124 RepID=UPI003B95FE96